MHMPTAWYWEEDVRKPGGALPLHLWLGMKHIHSFLGDTEVVFTSGMEWGPFVGCAEGLYENLKMSYEYLLFGEICVTIFWGQAMPLLCVLLLVPLSRRDPGRASWGWMLRVGRSSLAEGEIGK